MNKQQLPKTRIPKKEVKEEALNLPVKTKTIKK